MAWQQTATGLMVVFAALLLLRRLPWFSTQRQSGCSSCHGCAKGVPAEASIPLVQLGIDPASDSGARV
jgi:hypothetical protein